jgi:hypothetical protein
LLAESKLWEAELRVDDTSGILTERGIEELNGKKFSWLCDTEKPEDSNLLRLSLKTSWHEKARGQEYSFELFTYLFKEPRGSVKQ